jgi:hypothetical protein
VEKKGKNKKRKTETEKKDTQCGEKGEKKKENRNRKKNAIKRERKKKENRKKNEKKKENGNRMVLLLGSSLDRNARAGHDQPIPNASVVCRVSFFFFICSVSIFCILGVSFYSILFFFIG